jgi:hypothetical protein
LKEAGEWLELCGKKEPPLELSRLHLRTVKLCAETHGFFDNPIRDDSWKIGLHRIIKSANSIDSGYQDWINKHCNFEPWGYKESTIVSGNFVPFDGKVQVYHDLWVAFIWIGCYSKRTHLNEVLLHAITLLESTGEQLVFKIPSKYIIESMVVSICASVPFMLGDIDSECQPLPEARRIPLGGYLLIWPLHVARWSIIRDSPMEAWTIRAFEFIDQQLGMRYARMIASMERTEPWKLV